MAIANTTLLLKKSATPGTTPSALANGEIAINYADGKLYYKNNVGSIIAFSAGTPTNSFSTVNANSSLILATSSIDTLSIVPGNNITISTNTTSKSITINSLEPIGQAAYNQANTGTVLAQAAFDKANTGASSGSLSGYLANSVIFANTSGYLSNTNGISFYRSNNTLVAANISVPIIYTTLNGIVFPDGTSQTTAASGAATDASARANTVYTQGVDVTQNTNIQTAWNTANNALPNVGLVITVNSSSQLVISNTTASTNTTTGALVVNGGVGINGALNATTKSFVINHPTKPGMSLRYGSLESPYHGVRLTGQDLVVNGICVVKLPDYIYKLVKSENVNIQITNIKHDKVLWVDDVDVENNQFTVKTKQGFFDKIDYEFYWTFTAARKDVDDLQVEG